MNYRRRDFLRSMAAGTAALPFSGLLASEWNAAGSGKIPISFFTKPLDSYGPDFLTDTLAMAGFDGLDLTVRPKGSVLPEQVEEDLPKMAAMAQSKGLLLEMMVSNITSAVAPMTEKVLYAAAESGIRHYRLGYYRYRKDKGMEYALQEIGGELEALAALNQHFGIQGGYQNHRGIRYGAPMWDLWQHLKQIPVEWMSSQFDICHAVCEGSHSWILSMELLSPCIGSLALKDFTWDVSGERLRVVQVPMGEGVVDFDAFFTAVKKLGIRAPISIHVEYPLLRKEEEGLPLLQQQERIVSLLKKEVAFVQQHLKKYQIS